MLDFPPVFLLRVEELRKSFGEIQALRGVSLTFFGNLKLPMAVSGHEGSTVTVILNGLRLLGGTEGGIGPPQHGHACTSLEGRAVS